MQTFLPLLGMALLSFARPALGAANWEVCLDKANFSYDADTSLLAGNTYSTTKDGCRVTLAVSGGKGERWIVNLCDPSIHVDHYASLDEKIPKRLFAGSAGCPAPLFGADFDDNAKEINEYKEARNQIFVVWDKVKEAYGEGWEKVNIDDSGAFSPDKSTGQIACGQFLLKEYLKNCMSFEEKRPEPPRSSGKSDLIGVHDQTIPRK